VKQTRGKNKRKAGQSSFDVHLPKIISDTSFPSMDELLNDPVNPYPEIPVVELQRVAMDLCGLPLERRLKPSFC
jgi:hypothetical protein